MIWVTPYRHNKYWQHLCWNISFSEPQNFNNWRFGLDSTNIWSALCRLYLPVLPVFFLLSVRTSFINKSSVKLCFTCILVKLFNSFNKIKKNLFWLRRSIYFDSYQYSVCPRGLAILNITVTRDVLDISIHILIQRRPQSGDNVAGVDTYKHSLPPLLLSPWRSNG